MPRPSLPPTPASSTDLKGQEPQVNARLGGHFQAFELPPPALATEQASQPCSTELEPSGSKSYFPIQPSETVKSRRRSSATQPVRASKDTFALPPPPPRARKIIQMKPRQQEPATSPVPSPTLKPLPTKKPAAGSGVEATAPAAPKKKQPSATSAAGRKIARKTAHSLIERRRRFKMNEEFGVLKSLIPACTGEMHKLAILQASIEYIRYLEDCVQKLKNNQEISHSAPSPVNQELTPSPLGTTAPTYNHARIPCADPSGDVEMTGSHLHSSSAPSAFAPRSAASSSHRHSESPAMHAEDDLRHRNNSYSSMTHDQRHYSFSNSTMASPSFPPQQSLYASPYMSGYAKSTYSISGSNLASPAIGPQQERDMHEMDQEATAALLMLNKDTRGSVRYQQQPLRDSRTQSYSSTTSNMPSKRMSVQDLLSS